MKVKPLQAQQPATIDGRLPSLELVEVIQRLALQVNTLTVALDAIRGVGEPVGGATVDAEARAAINAIRGT